MVRLFFVALMFYTRIPVGNLSHGNGDDLNKATGFLPAIGLIVGGLSAAAYILASLALPAGASVVIAMIAGVFLTGAFHEDGFADTCDGLGGGWTVEDRLRIMKDSRVGSYALVGIVLLFLLKFALLTSMESPFIPFALITSHIAARMTPLLLIKILPYVRADEQSKVRPVSKGIGAVVLLGGIISACTLVSGLYFLLLPGSPLLLTVLLTPFVLSPIIAAYYRRALGGYTGDLLGAAEQIGEVAALMILVAL